MMEGEVWQCAFCGSELEFDAQTRRARLRYVPRVYAPIARAIGTAWLTRREMFQRAALAEVVPPAPPPLLAPLVALTAVSVVGFVVLAAIAAALLLQPDLERTRRAIAAAYARATITPATPSVETPPVSALISMTSEPTPDASPDTPPTVSNVPAPDFVRPTENLASEPALPPFNDAPLPPTAPPQPTPSLPVFIPPQPTPPPTFTPQPTTPLPQITLPPALISPLPTPTAPPAPTVPLPTPTLPSPTPSPTALPATPVPLIRIVEVKPQGDPAINEADEYIALENIAPSAVLMERWTLRVFAPPASNELVAQFTFPPGFIMIPGQRCRVYTNLTFGAENCGLSNGFRSPTGILPPSGARIVLSNEQGVEQASYVY